MAAPGARSPVGVEFALEVSENSSLANPSTESLVALRPEVAQAVTLVGVFHAQQLMFKIGDNALTDFKGKDRAVNTGVRTVTIDDWRQSERDYRATPDDGTDCFHDWEELPYLTIPNSCSASLFVFSLLLCDPRVKSALQNPLTF